MIICYSKEIYATGGINFTSKRDKRKDHLIYELCRVKKDYFDSPEISSKQYILHSSKCQKVTTETQTARGGQIAALVALRNNSQLKNSFLQFLKKVPGSLELQNLFKPKLNSLS